VTASARAQQETSRRRERIVGMRAAGMTYEAIGRAEGVSAAAAAQHYTRALRDRAGAQQSAGDDVALELIRLDGYERAANAVLAQSRRILNPAAPATEHLMLDPDLALRAVDRLVRISRRRSEVLGWDLVAGDGERSQPLPGQAQATGSHLDQLAERRAARRADAR
jgi:hypothetical protein